MLHVITETNDLKWASATARDERPVHFVHKGICATLLEPILALTRLGFLIKR